MGKNGDVKMVFLQAIYSAVLSGHSNLEKKIKAIYTGKIYSLFRQVKRFSFHFYRISLQMHNEGHDGRVNGAFS